MVSVAFLVGEEPRAAERDESRYTDWIGITKLVTGAVAWATIVIIGDVEMSEVDSDFLS
jgi:hypothetical protein